MNLKKSWLQRFKEFFFSPDALKDQEEAAANRKEVEDNYQEEIIYKEAGLGQRTPQPYTPSPEYREAAERVQRLAEAATEDRVSDARSNAVSAMARLQFAEDWFANSNPVSEIPMPMPYTPPSEVRNTVVAPTNMSAVDILDEAPDPAAPAPAGDSIPADHVISRDSVEFYVARIREMMRNSNAGTPTPAVFTYDSIPAFTASFSSKYYHRSETTPKDNRPTEPSGDSALKFED